MKKGRRSKFRPEFPAGYNFDYKDPLTLYRFVMEGGKIVPSRISKLSNPQQRQVADAIKKARNLALLPSGNDGYDQFRYPQGISPKPFEI